MARALTTTAHQVSAEAQSRSPPLTNQPPPTEPLAPLTVLQVQPTEPLASLVPPQLLHPPHTELQDLLEPPLTEPQEPLDLPADQELLDKPPPPPTKESPTLEDQESAEADTLTKPKNTDFLKSLFDYL